MKRTIKVNTEGKVKLILSFSLLIYSVVVGIITENIFVFPAMMLSTLGDISIMSYRKVFYSEGKEYFVNGVLFFALAHYCYLICMETKYTVPNVIIATILLFIVVLIFTFVKEKRSDVISVPYALVLLVNVFNALNFGLLAGIGGLLFLASDSILSIGEKKKAEGIAWQWAIWLTYVPAQALLLTAILLK